MSQDCGIPARFTPLSGVPTRCGGLPPHIPAVAEPTSIHRRTEVPVGDARSLAAVLRPGSPVAGLSDGGCPSRVSRQCHGTFKRKKFAAAPTLPGADNSLMVAVPVESRGTVPISSHGSVKPRSVAASMPIKAPGAPPRTMALSLAGSSEVAGAMTTSPSNGIVPAGHPARLPDFRGRSRSGGNPLSRPARGMMDFQKAC